MINLKYVEIYFNERLYDIFAGLPYKYASINGELNYRLRMMYNNNNLVPRNVIPENAIAIDGEYQFKVVKFVQMYQEVSSIALWNPVASIIFASSTCQFKQRGHPYQNMLAKATITLQVLGTTPTDCSSSRTLYSGGWKQAV